jgi:hypothetical protein
MLQGLLGNPVLLQFFAKFWKGFKQKNPIIAAIIFLSSSTLILYSNIAPDYGLGLPKWLSFFITLAALVINGANGSDTHQYLEQSEEKS